ncbi:uncharacterized protein LOC129583018 isoform X2 [Paramacrobiotus metropolitanus]|uniref:uncharacterized protein LOC129583018 isoform X2 n=1 Tax=Paramacrobiotus metropolitanus TaxID=2943436 RepID=UPI002445E03F|nr:uncharacterized protein LOC129583018 isoform X2 [Paramacrobiotus metropolitanus]
MAVKKPFAISAEKERFPSYPEILTESVLVLWFACQICLKFGLRILPQWRDSRLDPDQHNDFDLLLQMSGFKVNACFWDDVMSGWMSPHPVTVTHSTLAGLLAVPSSASYIVLGYAATLTTILLTALLGVSLFYVIFINRDWTSPVSKEHFLYCRGLAALSTKHSRMFARIQLPDYVTAVLVVVAVSIGPVVHYAVWVVFSALPVVLVAWMSVIAAVAVFGPSAVFPGCVLFSIVLAVYCCGRIWGVWMNETYSSLIKTGIRILIPGKSTVKPSPIAPLSGKTLIGLDSSQRQEDMDGALRSLLAFFLGCIAVYYNVWPLCQQFPVVNQWQSTTGSANWTYWHVTNTTGSCSKHGTNFDQGTAMLSYWVDLQSEELRSLHTSNSELLASFTPRYPSAVGWAFLVWSGVLSGATGVPFTGLQYAQAILIGLVVLLVGGLLFYDGVSACYSKWRRRVMGQRSAEASDRDKSQLLPADVAVEATGVLDIPPSDKTPVSADVAANGTGIAPSDPMEGNTPSDQVTAETKSEHGAPMSIDPPPMASTANIVAAEARAPFCLCEQLGSTWVIVLGAHCPLVCMVLPYSLVGLSLPEELQLPGLLLLLTAYTVWMYGMLVKFVWEMCCGVQSITAESKCRRASCGGGTATTRPKQSTAQPPRMKYTRFEEFRRRASPAGLSP